MLINVNFSSVCTFKKEKKRYFSEIWPDIQRWELIKENKNSTKKAIKKKKQERKQEPHQESDQEKKEKLSYFLDHFLGRVLVFFIS